MPESYDNSATLLYLDLMKRCLTNWIYPDAEMQIKVKDGSIVRSGLVAMANAFARKARTITVEPNFFDPAKREIGFDWPPFAHTMIGLRRLDNIQQCVQDILKNDIPGDLIEAGAWRGGASIFMRSILKAYGDTTRRVFVADSFEGLPPPDPKYPADTGSQFHTVDGLKVSADKVRSNFDRYGLLDDQVVFLKGWFKDTLPSADIGSVALIRADGDMYGSSMDIFENLYDKLSPGGYIIIDDYDLSGCRQATIDFRRGRGITEPIIGIEGTGGYWQKHQ